MSKLLGIAASIFFLFVASAANAGSWTVARSSGQAWIAAGGQWVSLGAVKDLPNGATVATGKDGRIQLARGKETMTVGPGAVVTIPGDNIFGFTTIVQWAGEVAFDVEKRNVRHFEVDTPYLAAVVKGTRFIVRVGRSGARVSVSRGLVGVANSSGQRTDVLPGQAAEVSGRAVGLVLSGPSGVIPLQESSFSSVGPGKGNDIGKEQSKGKDKGASSGNNSGGHGSGGDSGHGSGGNSGSGSGSNSGSGNSGSGGNSGHGSGSSGGGDDDD